jgi:hypothetical protein
MLLGPSQAAHPAGTDKTPATHTADCWCMPTYSCHPAHPSYRSQRFLLPLCCCCPCDPSCPMLFWIIPVQIPNFPAATPPDREEVRVMRPPAPPPASLPPPPPPAAAAGMATGLGPSRSCTVLPDRIESDAARPSGLAAPRTRLLGRPGLPSLLP